MLVAPNVGEEEPADVRESRNPGRLVPGVVSPDKGNKHIHEIGVFSIRGDTCDWKEKVHFDPAFDGLSQHVLV